jgi:hypothetical protein
VTGRWRNSWSWAASALAVLGFAAIGVTAWLSNTDKHTLVVAGLVAAAVVAAATVPLQLSLAFHLCCLPGNSLPGLSGVSL